MGKKKVQSRDPVLLAFGLAVQRRRRELKISQEEAAARIGIHRTYFADVERGARNIGLRNVVAVARGLESTPSALLKNIL
jgi:transcriptional regulator with XRE-family HTH domain